MFFQAQFHLKTTFENNGVRMYTELYIYIYLSNAGNLTINICFSRSNPELKSRRSSHKYRFSLHSLKNHPPQSCTIIYNARREPSISRSLRIRPTARDYLIAPREPARAIIALSFITAHTIARESKTNVFPDESLILAGSYI